MLVSYQWLCELVDLKGISAEDIQEKLNQTGIEVENIYNRNKGIENVVIGKVLSIEKHPEADRLKICKVDVGEASLLQIICGASNVKENQLVPVALVGATLPGLKIKKAKLRGVESFGMICSATELGLEDKYLDKEQLEGILVLEEGAEVGQNIGDYLGLSDQVIEMELTPNRSDCLGMIGVAYEVSAILNRPLKLPHSLSVVEDPSSKDKIQIDYEEDCPFYATQIVRNLKVDSSPQWLKNRLIAAGIRPINSLVDVTNYVMLETGQPLHAFDLEKLRGDTIEVTRSTPGESVLTLDGVTRAFDHETILIKNNEDILAIAGIMGSKKAEVTTETTSILLESAFFDPVLIRRASRKLGLRSEASLRFEKGVDPDQIIPALLRASSLLQQICEGSVVSSVNRRELIKIEDVEIQLRHKRINQVLGIQIDSHQVLDMFKRLQLPARFEEDIYFVKIPTRRPDLMIEVDLIEEIARLYGYDYIPTTLPWGQQTPGSLTKEQKLRRIIRHTLRTLGMSEVITYNLTSIESENKFPSIHGLKEPIRIVTPLGKERSILRTNLLPHLIEAASYNLHHNQKDVALFEMSNIYLSEEKKLTQIPNEYWELAGITTEPKEPYLWKKDEATLFYLVKGKLAALFERVGIKNVEYEKVELEGFHPGRTAHIWYQGSILGVIGELHPSIRKQYDLPRSIVFRVNLSRFCELDESFRYVPFVRFPAVSRDMAMVVDKKIPAGDIEKEIRTVAGPLLESVSLFDVFTGEQVGDGLKSLAFALTYRASHGTLTEEEVEEVHHKIIAHLVEKLSAKPRE